MSLRWTLVMLTLGVVLCGVSRWQEARPRELGETRLVPTTVLLGAGVVLIVVAAAHLVSLLTGVHLRGRFGP